MLRRGIETTDATGRQREGFKRAFSFYEREHSELTRAIELGHQAIARGEGDPAQTRASIATLQSQLHDLENGWERSTLRQRMAARTTSSTRAEARTLSSSRTAPSRSAGTATSSTTLTGYAARFNSLSQDLGGFVERIMPGAFAETLRAHTDILGLYHHRYEDVLARTSAFTLEIAENLVGLKFSMQLADDDSLGRNITSRVRRRDIHGMSFGFWPGQERWLFAQGPDGIDIRELVTIDRLFEISVTAVPAYLSTSVHVVEPSGRSEPSRSAGRKHTWSRDQEFPDRDAYTSESQFNDAVESWEYACWLDGYRETELRRIEKLLGIQH